MDKPTVPSYQRIKQELLESIANGHYTANQSFITQKEVCQSFQVSRITAERAINELVRDGVLVRHRGKGTFVAERSLLPTSAASSSSPSPFRDTKPVIACIMSVTRSNHKTDILRGIDQICREADCHLLFFDSGESPLVEATNLQRAMQANVSGIVIYPVDSYHNISMFEELLERQIPLVMIDRYYPTLSTDVVVPDNVSAGYEITKALIKQGHHRIAPIWEEITSTSVQERLIGYKQALREAHLQIDSEMATLRSYKALQEDERYHLFTSWMSSATPPTAIVTVNSLILGMVVVDLLHLGMQIGKDIVLASMDKDYNGISLPLGCTSVILPSYEMGSQAMRLLLNRLQDGSVPTQHIVLPVTLSTPAPMIINAPVDPTIVLQK